MTLSPTPIFSGEIYVSRMEDREPVGRILIRSGADNVRTTIAVRHHGALGAQSTKEFADIDEAGAWVAANPNKPLLLEDNPAIRWSGDPGMPRILILELPDGHFIGINPNGKTGPALHARNATDKRETGGNYIKKTKTAWSVFVNDQHHATRKCVKEALLCFAEALQPRKMSGHERLRWKADVIDNLKRKLETEPLPFNPDVIPAETSGYKNR